MINKKILLLFFSIVLIIHSGFIFTVGDFTVKGVYIEGFMAYTIGTIEFVYAFYILFLLSVNRRKES